MIEQFSDRTNMASNYQIVNQLDTKENFNEIHAFALHVLVGLSESKKSLSSKYFYNARGSELFRKISFLKEYYLTNSEIEILQSKVAEIEETMEDREFNLVELGAGFGRKTKFLVDHMLSSGLKFRYVPIDISEGSMDELVTELGKTNPELEVCGLVSDYYNGLKWLNNRYKSRNFVMFLGSSIGNFTHGESRVFLRNLWNSLNNGDKVLIGFDLKKDIELLLSAYNDSEGVTAQFNLNLLLRINEELGGEFDLNKFRYFSTYDLFAGGIKSYLVSLEKQEVYIEKIGRSFSFEPWEPIHTEYSYKYLVPDIERLASETGFLVEKHLFDSKRYFVDSIWKVYKPGNLLTE